MEEGKENGNVMPVMERKRRGGQGMEAAETGGARAEHHDFGLACLTVPSHSPLTYLFFPSLSSLPCPPSPPIPLPFSSPLSFLIVPIHFFLPLSFSIHCHHSLFLALSFPSPFLPSGLFLFPYRFFLPSVHLYSLPLPCPCLLYTSDAADE